MRKMYSKNQIESIVNDVALPEIESGDAGKVLTVNESETGAVWAEASGGKLYEHNVQVDAYNNSTHYKTIFNLRLITKSSIAITLTDIVSTLYNLFNAFTSISATGGAWVTTDDPIVYYPIVSIRAVVATGVSRIDVFHVKNDGGIAQASMAVINSVSDTVREL